MAALNLGSFCPLFQASNIFAWTPQTCAARWTLGHLEPVSVAAAQPASAQSRQSHPSRAKTSTSVRRGHATPQYINFAQQSSLLTKHLHPTPTALRPQSPSSSSSIPSGKVPIDPAVDDTPPPTRLVDILPLPPRKTDRRVHHDPDTDKLLVHPDPEECSLLQPRTMARVYADVNANMPRSYWDYDSVNIAWGVLDNYEVVRKIGQFCSLSISAYSGPQLCLS